VSWHFLVAYKYLNGSTPLVARAAVGSRGLRRARERGREDPRHAQGLFRKSGKSGTPDDQSQDAPRDTHWSVTRANHMRETDVRTDLSV